MAWAIICIPEDRQLSPEVIRDFPDEKSARRFAHYLETENKWWKYYPAIAREPMPNAVTRRY